MTGWKIKDKNWRHRATVLFPIFARVCDSRFFYWFIYAFIFYFVATGARSYYSTRARTARLTSSIRREKHWRPSPSQLMASTWCQVSAATNRPCAFGISLSAHRWPSSPGTSSASFALWVFFLLFIKLAYCITQMPFLLYLLSLDAALSLVMCKKAGCVQLD